MNILDAVQARGAVLKKVAPARGGEWAGPCLVCNDGDDRFRCWPNRDPTKQVFFCRHCKPRGGDLIEFFRWADGMSYQQACKAAGCKAKRYHYAKPSLPSYDRKLSFMPASHDDPNEIWHKKAEEFVAQAHEHLMNDTEVLAWLHEKRGISAEGARRFKLGLNSDGKYFRPRESWGLPTLKNQNGKPKKLWLPRGLVIPYIVDDRVQRIRIRRPKSDLKEPADPPYYFVPGSSPAIMLIGKNMKAYMVVESELDGILIAQAAGDLVGVMAMGTATSKPDEQCAVHLSKAEDILVSLDSDTAGNNGSDWWLDAYCQAVRWHMRCGKDPGEMFKKVDVRQWVLAGLPPVYHYRNGPFRLNRFTEGKAADQEEEVRKD